MTPRRQAILDAWMSGMSGLDVAAAFGITRQRVSQIVRAANAPPRKLRDQRHLRFWRHVERSDEGCWEWRGGRYRDTGYGRAYVPRLRDFRGAHRVSWELTNGLIPPGLWVLHRCDNPPCVRPDHLFLGTPRDNVHDSMQKGRRPVAKEKRVA